MRKRSAWFAVIVSGALALSGCGAKPGDIDAARLIAANSDNANWITYGRTYDEQRFSPLNDINERNVADLGLAWSRCSGGRNVPC